jgi:hypothetical protein
MYSHRIPFIGAAAVWALVALAATAPTYADELARNVGPVGPHQPILTTVGSKRVLAFYVPDGGLCDVFATVWESTDVQASSVTRFRVSLGPRQVLHLDCVGNASLSLRCGDHAETLAIVETSKFVANGIAK